MPILHHILDYVRFSLKVLETRKLFMSFVRKGEILPELADEFTMCAVVVLCANVALDEYIDLNG